MSAGASSSVVPFKLSIPSLAMDEGELIAVLTTSIYPGARVESVKLVIGYCKAGNLDPLQKPVHIVPMDIPTGKKDDQGWDIKEKRDVVMPGIGLYRIQAARTGEYAGITEPEFGDDIDHKLGDTEITYPEWCRITVKRIVQGHIVEFTAKELWLENYASKSRSKKDPNAMWAKRPYAQLAKCAEAQALRKAFPEIGAQPTAEEMEGKDIDGTSHVVVEGTVTARQIEQPRSRSETNSSNSTPPTGGSADGNQQAGDGASSSAETTKKESPLITEGAKRTLEAALKRASRSEADLTAAGFPKIGELRFDRFNQVMDWIKTNPANAG